MKAVSARSIGALLRRIVNLHGDATHNAAGAVADDDNARRERQSAHPSDGQRVTDFSTDRRR
jgi:hypothetical protein